MAEAAGKLPEIHEAEILQGPKTINNTKGVQGDLMISLGQAARRCFAYERRAVAVDGYGWRRNKVSPRRSRPGVRPRRGSRT